MLCCSISYRSGCYVYISVTTTSKPTKNKLYCLCRCYPFAGWRLCSEISLPFQHLKNHEAAAAAATANTQQSSHNKDQLTINQQMSLFKIANTIALTLLFFCLFTEATAFDPQTRWGTTPKDPERKREETSSPPGCNGCFIHRLQHSQWQNNNSKEEEAGAGLSGSKALLELELCFVLSHLKCLLCADNFSTTVWWNGHGKAIHAKTGNI